MSFARFTRPVIGLFVVAVSLTPIWATPRQSAAAESKLANTVVLVIRHAEKPETGTGLTPAGEARAKAYVNYFEHYRIDSHAAHIDAIFATKDSKNSARERLTVAPLSQALKLPVNLEYKNGEFQQLVDALKAKRYGSTILICWHHGKIPDMLRAFGADPNVLIGSVKWPADQFSWVIQLAFDKTGHLIPKETKKVPERLMPGDK